MLTLRTSKAPPDLVTVILPEGAKLFLRPWGTGVHVAAIRAYRAMLTETGDKAAADVAFDIGAIRAAVAGWEGFDTDIAPGEVAEFDRDLLDGLETLLVDDFDVYCAANAQYIAPALAREAEKNGSSLLPVGGSPAAAKTVANPSSTAGAVATTATPAKRGAKAARSTTRSPGRKRAT